MKRLAYDDNFNLVRPQGDISPALSRGEISTARSRGEIIPARPFPPP